MPVAPGRRGAIAFFVTFCICLVALAAALMLSSSLATELRTSKAFTTEGTENTESFLKNL
jgi:hypothetical protein